MKILNPCFLVQNTWTLSCRQPSDTSQLPLIKAFLVCGHFLVPDMVILVSWLQLWQDCWVCQWQGVFGMGLTPVLEASLVWSSILSYPQCVQQI